MGIVHLRVNTRIRLERAFFCRATFTETPALSPLGGDDSVSEGSGLGME